MSFPTNTQRAARAGFAMIAYDQYGATIYGDTEQAGPATVLQDLLSDLMHFADEFGVDFNLALDRAADNYEAEEREERETVVVVLG